VGLLERLSRADALGSTCEGMQRWAVDEVLGGIVSKEAAREARKKIRAAGETGAITLTHQLMRELIGQSHLCVYTCLFSLIVM
jgi:hypothetical protein